MRRITYCNLPWQWLSRISFQRSLVMDSCIAARLNQRIFPTGMINQLSWVTSVGCKSLHVSGLLGISEVISPYISCGASCDLPSWHRKGHYLRSINNAGQDQTCVAVITKKSEEMVQSLGRCWLVLSLDCYQAKRSTAITGLAHK